MKYKVKNKVKIKTWKEMEKEYGISSYGGNIKCYYNYFFTEYMEKEIEELNCNRILTIDFINDDDDDGSCHFYKMKELPTWHWSDSMIKCLAKDESEPITSRFEILDIR